MHEESGHPTVPLAVALGGFRKLQHRWQVVIVTTVVLVIVGASFFTWHIIYHPKHLIGKTSAFPIATVHELKGFTFYYLKPSFSTDYILVPSSIDYQANVLVFELQNPQGDSLAFTEEATPPGYDISALQADKQFQTGFGQAFITDGAARTTGTLFTSDKTWILINAPNPIGADLMQQILDALVPNKS